MLNLADQTSLLFSDHGHPQGTPSMAPPSLPYASAENSPSLNWVWVWDGGFVMADAKIRGSQVVTEKPCMLSVAGRFCSPQVDCRIVDAEERLPKDALGKVNSASTTWEFDEEHLLLLSTSLWEMLVKDEVRIDTLPVVPSNARDGIPYSFEGMSYVSNHRSRA